MTAVLSPADVAAKKYIDAKDCAARYGMSWRHWLRLVDSGRARQSTRFRPARPLVLVVS